MKYNLAQMWSAICYFRGNYMTPLRADLLLRRICSYRDLVPDYWNIYEPVNRPFDCQNLTEVIGGLAPVAPLGRGLVFLERKAKPAFQLTVDLRLIPVQGTTAHNSISIEGNRHEDHIHETLVQYLPRCIEPNYPDYASIPKWTQNRERYSEFRKSYTPEEFRERLLRPRPIELPFGPYGFIADIQWYNYFGRVYVEAIGKSRLLAAGWARIEEIGDGFGCYVTDRIDDPDFQERQSIIRNSIEEYVWTPGCRPQEKRVPGFDFTEQSTEWDRKRNEWDRKRRKRGAPRGQE